MTRKPVIFFKFLNGLKFFKRSSRKFKFDQTWKWQKMIIEMVIFYYVNDDFSLCRWWFFTKWMMIFHHVTSNNMVKIIICLVKNHYLMIKNYHLHDDEWSNFSRLRRLILLSIFRYPDMHFTIWVTRFW